MNNIVILQSGPVYDVTVNGGRVDIIGDPTPTAEQRARGIQLNKAAFRQARDFHDPTVFANGSERILKFGSLGRNIFRGDFQEYWDAGFFKNFRLGFINEQAEIQFRTSIFNVLNHVNRGRPNGDLNSDSFGKDQNEQRRRQLEFGLRFVF